MARDAEPGQCRQGLRRADCLREHVRELVPPARPKSGDDRECPACRKPLSVNPGKKGQRVVWCCDDRCDPAAVRAALVGIYGVDEQCLGNYGAPGWVRNEAKRKRQSAAYAAPADSATLIGARQRDVIAKLNEYEFESVALVKVCIHAVLESDGNVSPDPEHLLPRDYRELAALARRAGIERRYSYQFSRWWLSKSVA